MSVQASRETNISGSKDLKLPKPVYKYQDGRVTDTETAPSGVRNRTICPPNSPANKIKDRYLDTHNFSKREINYHLEESPKSSTEHESYETNQCKRTEVILSEAIQENLTITDNISPKKLKKNVCNCIKSEEQIVQDWRKIIKETVVKEVNHIKNTGSQIFTISKSKSDAETNTEVGIPFRNTPNTSVINMKTQETSTRLIENEELNECNLKKTLQIQTMPSVQIQPKFTIQKGPKIHIPPCSRGAAQHKERKNIQIKEFFHHSVSSDYKVGNEFKFENYNQNEEIIRASDQESEYGQQNIPNQICLEKKEEEINVHDKLNSLAKTLSFELDKNDKNKNKNYKMLSHTLKVLSSNISKLFDNYLETIPENLKRFSPRMNVIASLLLEELQSPDSLTDDYCCKLIDSMHYLIQDLEKEYEARLSKKNLQKPPQSVGNSAKIDYTKKSQLRRLQPKFTGSLQNSNLQTSEKQQLKNIVENKKVNPSKEKHIRTSLSPPKISEKNYKEKPAFNTDQQNTYSDVKSLLKISSNEERLKNRNPLLHSNYMMYSLAKNPNLPTPIPINIGQSIANTGAIPKTNRFIKHGNKQDRNYKLKQWQDERLQNIQEIHKKLLLTEMKLTRPEKHYIELNKIENIEKNNSSDSSAIDFVKKYLVVNNQVSEDSFNRQVITSPPKSHEGNVAETFSAGIDKNIEQTPSRSESKIGLANEDTSISEETADDPNSENEYAEDWEEDDSNTRSSQSTGEEDQKNLSLVERKEEKLLISAVNKLTSDNTPIQEHNLKSSEKQPLEEPSNEHEYIFSNSHKKEVSLCNELAQVKDKQDSCAVTDSVKIHSKGCNISFKKHFCDGIDQVPLDLAIFDSKNTMVACDGRSSTDIRPTTSNQTTNHISDLSTPNLKLDTSPIENLIKVSLPNPNKQGNFVEVNTDKANQSVNVIVHVVNDGNMSKLDNKCSTKSCLENMPNSDEANRNTIENKPSSSDAFLNTKTNNETVNINDLLSSNLKNYVIQPTINEIFQKFKVDNVLDSEFVQDKNESKQESKNGSRKIISNESQTTLNLIKPNVILESKSDIWKSLRELSVTNQDKMTQNETVTQDHAIQTDCEKLPVQTQVTESLASDSNQEKLYDDKTNSANFSKKLSNTAKKFKSSPAAKSKDSNIKKRITKKYVRSLQQKPSGSDSYSNSSTSSDNPYNFQSLKWSLSSLLNSDESFSEGEVVLSSSSSVVCSLGEVKSYSIVDEYSINSLGEVKTKPQRKTHRRGTETSTPELPYPVSKDILKSIPKHLSPGLSDLRIGQTNVGCGDNKGENMLVENFTDNSLPQSFISLKRNPSRLPQNKIVSRTFDQLASDILQELINEDFCCQDNSNEVKNTDNFVANSNMNEGTVRDKINSESVTVEADDVVQEVDYKIKTPKEVTIIKSKQVKVHEAPKSMQKDKLHNLKLSYENNKIEEEEENVQPSCSKIKKPFQSIFKKPFEIPSDRLVMKLDSKIPNLEVFIEDTPSEPSSLTLCTSYASISSSDDLPGACEFDLTLGSHSSGEIASVGQS